MTSTAPGVVPADAGRGAARGVAADQGHPRRYGVTCTTGRSLAVIVVISANWQEMARSAPLLAKT
jgi:hypothetical protein